MRTSHLSKWLAERTAAKGVSGSGKATLAARVDALWKGVGMNGLIFFLITPYMVLAFIQILPSRTVIVWAACVLLTIVARRIAYHKFVRLLREARDDSLWLNRLRFLVPLTALACGILPVVALPLDAPIQDVALLFFIALVPSVTALFSYGAYDLATISAYNIALFVPLLVYMMYGGRWLEAMLMAAIVVYLWPLARNANALVLGAIETREALKIEKAAAERAREEADAANRAKSRFLASASHDLRQPMHALTLFVTALKESWDQPGARKLVGQIENSVIALDQLFEALLDISKLDAGIIVPRLQSFAIAPLLQRLQAEFEPTARDKGLTLLASDCALSVHSDPTLLERILRNLLSNALRYTHTGSVSIVCSVEAGQLRIEVRDTGIGIAPEYLGEIFQEFYQVDNTERDRGKGLGLGLAIAKHVCELLEHDLTVHSELGSGSTFAVTAPLAEMQTLQTASPGSPDASLWGAFVLVIDDEASVREATRALLSASGCHVIAAASGTEALHALARHERSPDALVCDYRLPGGETGLAVIAKIKQALEQDVASILITGDTSPERLREAAASGYAILHKPVEAAKLRRTLALEIAAMRPSSQRDDALRT